jgi:hypothetical protein
MSAPGRFHHGPLYDVRLQPASPAARRRCQRTRLAARLKGLVHADALVVSDGQRVLQHHVGGVHPTAHHRRTKPATLLVGPVHQFERSACADACLIKCPHHFQTGKHAEHAIEPPAGRHRVEVAAKRHGMRRRVLSLAAEEHVADGILLEAEVERPAPFHQQCARLRILRRKCKAATAAFRRGSDARHVHDRLPQPV